MADEPTPEIPVPTPESAAPIPTRTPEVAATTPAAPPAKRKIWPFVLGGAILVFVLLIAGIIVAVTAVFGALGGDPKKTVTDYDLSFKNADCALFQRTTTDEFQQNFFGGELDCKQWEDNAKALTLDGVYQYKVEVVSSDVNGDAAEVVTNEVDSSSGAPVDYALRYFLTKSGGNWLIEGIDNETPE